MSTIFINEQEMEEINLDSSSTPPQHTQLQHSSVLTQSSSTTPLSNSSILNISSSNNESSGGMTDFVGQMEQVFKAIDKEGTGEISLSQLREEIDALGLDIDENPLISRLLSYLKYVHSSSTSLLTSSSGGSGGTFEEELQSLTSSGSIEPESNIRIDFDSFINSMSNFADGIDPQETRRTRLEKQRLPKFKIPMDLLKRYNIPVLLGNGGVNNNNGSYSHSSTAQPSTPSKNKFGRLFSTKPVVGFDQFNQLVTKLNYGKEVPKNKLLMFLSDLPTDTDGCIDINQFLSRFGGLNHPMSPKLTYEEISSGSGNQKQDNDEYRLDKSSGWSQWDKNSQLIDQLQDSYKNLEKECETFQSEISVLEKNRHALEGNLRKKEQEVDRLKKDARFVETMRDTNKDLNVQNASLKNQLYKLSQNEEFLRENLEVEKDKARSLSESVILKELEIKRLNLLLKNQQNINSKLSMMVTFSNEVDKSGDNKDKTFTAKRIKPAVDKAKQILNRQKSEIFINDGSKTLSKIDNFSILQQRFKQQQQQQQQQLSPQSSQSNLSEQLSPSLLSEFEDLKRQQENDLNDSTNNTELNQLKEQLQLFGADNIQLSDDLSFDNQIENTNNTPADELNNLSHISNDDQQQKQQDNTSSEEDEEDDDEDEKDSNSTANKPEDNSNKPTTISTLIASSSAPSTPPVLNTSNNRQPSTTNLNSSSTSIQNNSSSNTNSTTPPPQPFTMTSTPTTTTPPLSSSSKGTPTRASLTSPTYIRQSSPTLKSSPTFSPMSVMATEKPGVNNAPLSSGNLNHIQMQQQNTPPSPFNLSNIQHHQHNGSSLLEQSLNVNTMKRMKKSDLIKLATEMEDNNESAQILINQTTAALEEFSKNKAIEVQRLQKMYQEEKQANKILEKQLSLQLEKNKEMVTGKETTSWGGISGFFNFISNYLPSNLFCNLSSSS
eukprot:gene2179-2682_t